MDFLAPLCVEFHPLYVDLWPLCVDLTPHITKPSLAKHRFFVINITISKRFFMGAFVGALFARNSSKTNDKQCVSRGYDSESGTTHLKNPAIGWVFAILRYELAVERHSITRRTRQVCMHNRTAHSSTFLACGAVQRGVLSRNHSGSMLATSTPYRLATGSTDSRTRCALFSAFAGRVAKNRRNVLIHFFIVFTLALNLSTLNH